MKRSKTNQKDKTTKNEFIDNSHNEERKFSYINPVVNEDLNSKYIFWNYKSEVIGRILIIAGRLLAAALLIWFILLFRDNALSGNMGTKIKDFFDKYSIYLVSASIVIELSLSFIYILPQVLVKRSNSLHTWGFIYIYLGIFYFLFWETLFIATSILNNLKNADPELGLNSLGGYYIFFMIAILSVTIILIIGGALLITKSDDIRRQLTTE